MLLRGKNSLDISGQRGSITVEAMVLFPLVLLVLFTMIFFIAEGRLEMTMFNAISAGSDTISEEMYTMSVVGEGVSGLGKVLADNIFGGGKISNFAKSVIDSEGKLNELSQMICIGLLKDKAKNQVRVDVEESGYNDRFDINLIIEEDVFAEINQTSGVSLGPFLNAEPLRMTTYQKCWTGGSSDIKNWFEQSFPKENEEQVFVTRTGACYHLASCKESLNESCIPMLKDAAKLSGYRSCQLCSPGK